MVVRVFKDLSDGCYLGNLYPRAAAGEFTASWLSAKSVKWIYHCDRRDDRRKMGEGELRLVWEKKLVDDSSHNYITKK